jgi:hypothetical protein
MTRRRRQAARIEETAYDQPCHHLPLRWFHQRKRKERGAARARLAGAIWKGVRQARREHLKPRTHVRQAKVAVAAA